MKKYIALIALGCVAAGADVLTYNVNQAIPDDDPSGLQDTQVVSGLGPVISDLDVYLTISTASPGTDPAYNGDFFVTLLHDSGYSVLLNRIGITGLDPFGYSDTGFDVVFTLTGSDIHAYRDEIYSIDGAGRLTGNWGVDGRNVDPDSVLDTDARTAMLDSFVGLDPNGSWTLFVADMNPNGSAALESWGLDIQTVPEPASAIMLLFGSAIGIFIHRLRRNALRR